MVSAIFTPRERNALIKQRKYSTELASENISQLSFSHTAGAEKSHAKRYFDFSSPLESLKD